MTKSKPVKHKGEALMLMSGEYGTMLVEDGDTYPDWFNPPTKPQESPTEESE